jgi:DMSO/TMAO reductase YedYZ molybdopterin-dependent catalytic subunit
VAEPLTLTLADIRQRFEHVTLDAVLSCAGNRRSELAALAPIPGQAPWGPGATGNARWGGVRLRDVDVAYEKRSVAVTSNLHPAGFDTIMPKTLATATVDRLLHHAHVVVTEGPSLRLAEATAGKGVMPLE